jgi:hypothetical protein
METVATALTYWDDLHQNKMVSQYGSHDIFNALFLFNLFFIKKKNYEKKIGDTFWTIFFTNI